MTMNDVPSFDEEIRQLREQMRDEKSTLDDLENELAKFETRMEQCRENLDRLRRLNRGEIPEEIREAPSDGEIESVEKNPESGRPPRGARRKQIQTICERIGGEGRPFRTREVLDRLAEVEDDLTDGMKSYAYTVMDELAEDGVVEKVGWGQWELQQR